MTAKQYLKQIKALDNKIEVRLMDRYRLRCLSTTVSTTQRLDAVKVQSSPSKDPMGDLVARLVDVEDEIDRLVDEYIEKSNKIVQQIEAMENADYMIILSLRYIGYKSIEEIATERDYTLRHTKRLHAKALEQFARLYGDTF